MSPSRNVYAGSKAAFRRVDGLTKVDGGALGSCAAGDPVVSYVNYIVPGRPEDHDNASFQALTIGDRLVAMIAYDEKI